MFFVFTVNCIFGNWISMKLYFIQIALFILQKDLATQLERKIYQLWISHLQRCIESRYFSFFPSALSSSHPSHWTYWKLCNRCILDACWCCIKLSYLTYMKIGRYVDCIFLSGVLAFHGSLAEIISLLPDLVWVWWYIMQNMLREHKISGYMQIINIVIWL